MAKATPANRRRRRASRRPERRGQLLTPATRTPAIEQPRERASTAVETPLGVRFFLEITEEECRFIASRSLSEELIVHAKYMLWRRLDPDVRKRGIVP